MDVIGNSKVSQFPVRWIHDRPQSVNAALPTRSDPLTPSGKSMFYRPLFFSICRSIALCFITVAGAAVGDQGSFVSAQEPADQQPGAIAKVAPEDRVHLGDMIDVDVVGGFEFDWRGTLTPEGYLDGMEIYDAPIYALCRSEAEIAADIAKAYSKILRDPQVVVRIVDRSNRALARVSGAVRTPSRFSIRRAVSLREILVLAGGIAGGASGNITILRPGSLSCQTSSPPSDNGLQTINIKISDLLSGKIEANPGILSGDIVTVARAHPIYVIGAVNAPLPIYLTEQLTVSRAIATAGGLSKGANGSEITILRRVGPTTSEISVDLEKVKTGEIEDEILFPFDIIDVPTKSGGKRKYPPATPAISDREADMASLPLKVVD